MGRAVPKLAAVYIRSFWLRISKADGNLPLYNEESELAGFYNNKCERITCPQHRVAEEASWEQRCWWRPRIQSSHRRWCHWDVLPWRSPTAPRPYPTKIDIKVKLTSYFETVKHGETQKLKHTFVNVLDVSKHVSIFRNT